MRLAEKRPPAPPSERQPQPMTLTSGLGNCLNAINEAYATMWQERSRLSVEI
jgi:hypothetical protein